jgi:hypothetical protein
MRRPLWPLSFISCWMLMGCATTQGWLSSLNDNDDPFVQHEEKWVEQTGLEARGNRPRDMSPEPRWFRELTMSDEARGIERNLGYYD